MTISSLLEGIVPDAIIEGDTLDGDFDIVHPIEPYNLFDYQEDALAHVFDRGALHAYLGLDMGLGKSLIAWALAATVRAPGPYRYKRPVLFVVPPALRRNIVREGNKFYPGLDVAVIDSAPGDDAEVPEADVIIIGDASLKGRTEKDDRGVKQFIPEGWAALLAGKVDAVVVDEAHRHKNNSGRSNALAYITGMCAGFKVLMSGTPTPNGRNIEIARQIDIMGSGAWADIGGKGYFYTHFAPIVDPRFGTRESVAGEVLHEMMSSTWYMRRLRADVVELPNKARTFVGIEGSGKGARDYLKAETDLISYLADEDKNWEFNERAEALVRLNNLRRLAGVARAPGVAAHVKDILDSDKDADEPQGVFIVAEHGEVIDTLLLKLGKYRPTAIRGGMSDNDRDEAVDDFTSGRSRVMIGQITSAGTGFTLHGEGRNRRVVFAQLPWTPAEVRQAEDRLHRIGQTNDVLVELTGVVIDGAQNGTTVDERLWSSLESKAFRAGQLQDGEGTFLIDDVESELLDSYR